MKIKTFKSIFLAAFFLLGFGIVSSFAQTPDSVVKELYKIHNQDLKSNRDSILNNRNRQNLDKFFDKTLADFIWKDLTTHRNEVGVLDFDPFYNAQDFDIKNFLISSVKTINLKSSVTVKFTNAGRKDTLVYQLVKQAAGWKITDIRYTDGSSLLKYFKEYAKQNK